MKIIQINTVYPYGSTGRICKGISELCNESEIENYIACSYRTKINKNDKHVISITTSLDNHIHNRLARITMKIGCFSIFHTVLFLRKLSKINPDIIHLHNLHGNYVNIPLLFRYIKKSKTPVIWTLHDCWAYTGYCTHYTLVNCMKWKTECYSCPNRHYDKVTKFDNSKRMFHAKKRMFSGIENLTLITPSNWLYGEVKESFLKNYRIKIIKNGIDLSIFKPVSSDFRVRNHIKNDEFMILGVSFGWSKNKGLDVFIEIAKLLNKKYKIVLVGTDEGTDEILPSNIISLHRTNNIKKLAEIYSAADLFVNPTREEMFGLVNIEALACGTPVITFQTGGSPESIDCTCGSVVPSNDIQALTEEIVRICKTKPYSKEACLKRAELFDINQRFQEYVDLYREIINE